LIIGLRRQLAGQGLDAGAHTIAWHLAEQHQLRVSAATIWRTLKRAGLISPEPMKKPRASYVRFAAEQPNQMWHTDFTHYRLTRPDGTPGADAEILCFLDDHSRYAAHSSSRKTSNAGGVDVPTGLRHRHYGTHSHICTSAWSTSSMSPSSEPGCASTHACRTTCQRRNSGPRDDPWAIHSSRRNIDNSDGVWTPGGRRRIATVTIPLLAGRSKLSELAVTLVGPLPPPTLSSLPGMPTASASTDFLRVIRKVQGAREALKQQAVSPDFLEQRMRLQLARREPVVVSSGKALTALSRRSSSSLVRHACQASPTQPASTHTVQPPPSKAGGQELSSQAAAAHRPCRKYVISN
jgi:hypothetical protein